MAVDFNVDDTISDLEQGSCCKTTLSGPPGWAWLRVLVGASVQSDPDHFRKNWQGWGRGRSSVYVVRERGRGSAGRVIAKGVLRLRPRKCAGPSSTEELYMVEQRSLWSSDLADRAVPRKPPPGGLIAAVAVA